MFDNISDKIKRLAKALCWIGIIGSIICGILMFVAAGEASWQLESVYITLGVVIIIVGSLGAWLGSLTLYGFGELIERATSIDKKLSAQNSPLNKQHISTPAVPAKPAQSTHPNPQPIQKEHSNSVPPHPAIEQPTTRQEPVIEEAPPTVESKPIVAYDDSELQILQSLLQEGKLSEEEYQNCLSNLQK